MTQPDEKANKSFKVRALAWWKKNRPRIIVVSMLFLVTVIYFHDLIFISIYPGHRGVKWSRWSGTNLTRTYGEGLHIIPPWNKMYIYDMRIQEKTRAVDLLSSDGLVMHIDLSIRYFLDPKLLTTLHTRIGPEYHEKVVMPEAISALRRVLGNYSPEEIYFRDEQGLILDIQQIAKERIEIYPIKMHDLLLIELSLPKDVQEAINEKHAKEQLSLAHKFVIEREKQERERREIEAHGIKSFQYISGISILKWRGIEATENLARSENAKFIVIGSDESSLPVILNVDK